jgi:hypothetical protein
MTATRSTSLASSLGTLSMSDASVLSETSLAASVV